MTEYRRYVYWVLGLILAVTAVFWLAEFYTDWLWYRHDADVVVFNRRVLTRLFLFAGTFVAVWGLFAGNLRLVLRGRPVHSERFRGVVDDETVGLIDQSVAGLVRWLPILVAFVGGVAVAESWQLWLQAWYGVPFGQADPIFGRDIGFYVYRLAAWRQLLSSLTTLLVLILAAVGALHYYLQNIELENSTIRYRREARTHIVVLVAVLLLIRVGLVWLRRYGLVMQQHALFPGATWTDVHLTQWGLVFSAITALLAALACLWVARPGVRARAAYWAIGLHLVGFVLLVKVVPAFAQRVVVLPNEIVRERPYIEHAIAGTRAAFALENVEDHQFPAVAGLEARDLAANEGTIENIRVWDHRPLLRTFKQLQEIRQYYDIIDVDSDRYALADGIHQVLIAARELNHRQLDPKAQSWINRHVEYTHGYGVVASSASRVGNEGQPAFLVRDIPPQAVEGMEVTEPRIYFGEVILMPTEEEPTANPLLPHQREAGYERPRPDQAAERNRRRLNSILESDESDYLLVNTERDEFDYAETVGDKSIKHRTRYAGESGVPIGGFLNKLAFSLALQSVELATTTLTTPESRLLLHRQVTRRCQKAAPFLQWDVDPYPVIVDGRIYFICEAYTYSQSYPYSQLHYERVATPKGWAWTPTWNYLRNPVKGIVDAYDGTVDLYVVDEQDPLIKTYERIYPGLFTPGDSMPAGLRRHLRYPTLQFRTQAKIYTRYHMTDATTFYAQEDLWTIARQADSEIEREAQRRGKTPKAEELYREMQPYYITMQLPGRADPEFMLLTAFTPYSAQTNEKDRNQRDNMIAWMVAVCDPERYGQLVVYNFPRDTNVYGPLQIEARIDQDDAISQQITLWDTAGSQVVRGELLVVPVESSLLYVQPLYLESDKRGLPELKRVIVAYQDQVVMEPTLSGALGRLFGDVPVGVSDPGTPLPKPAPAAPAAPAPGPGVDPGLVAQAQQAFDAGEDALRRGDWVGYERERGRLRAVLERMGR